MPLLAGWLAADIGALTARVAAAWQVRAASCAGPRGPTCPPHPSTCPPAAAKWEAAAPYFNAGLAGTVDVCLGFPALTAQLAKFGWTNPDGTWCPQTGVTASWYPLKRQVREGLQAASCRELTCEQLDLPPPHGTGRWVAAALNLHVWPASHSTLGMTSLDLQSGFGACEAHTTHIDSSPGCPGSAGGPGRPPVSRHPQPGRVGRPVRQAA